MATRTRTADFAIVGAGIIGLALARELRRRHAGSSIVVFEKESEVGLHASGRNSGVLHSGIYYDAGSLKAMICASGSRELAEYCEEHGLPIRRCGKVVIAARESEDGELDSLLQRATANGAKAELIDTRQLAAVEPEACAPTGRALHCPDTAVVQPKAILGHLQQELAAGGVEFLFDNTVVAIDVSDGIAKSANSTVRFGHLFNAAGLHADRIALLCGVGSRYAILPFKGLYYSLLPSSGLCIRGLIYPVPDQRVPFLGIHFTRQVDGDVEIGPSALPSIGRENYEGLRDIHLAEATRIAGRILDQYVRNKRGFRRFAHTEALRLFKTKFADAARKLVPRLRSSHLGTASKVGIRAQLLDRETRDLVMDFVVEQGEHSTHVLNAVSPAFTSAFAFARVVAGGAGF